MVVPQKKSPAEAGLFIWTCARTQILRAARRREPAQMPSRPRPNRLSVAGSGTAFGVKTALISMSSWLSSGPAPESSQNSQAVLPLLETLKAIDWLAFQPSESFCWLVTQPTRVEGPDSEQNRKSSAPGPTSSEPISIGFEK